jgi:ssDNA-binding Zn-finger/Zn-ribbon topoisomerase 1
VTAPAEVADFRRAAAAWSAQWTAIQDSGSVIGGPAYAIPRTRPTCPHCSSPLIERFDGREHFLGCSGYAAGCRYSRPAPSDLPCPCHKATCQHSEPCGGSLSPRPGRWGDFLRCDRDECGYTRSVAAKAILTDEERRARQLSASAARSRRYRAKAKQAQPDALVPQTSEPAATPDIELDEADQRIRDGVALIREKAREAGISDGALARLRVKLSNKASSRDFDLADVQSMLTAIEEIIASYATKKARYEATCDGEGAPDE